MKNTGRQSPIHSGFGRRTTAAEVLEGRRLDGMVAVVTGGYCGIGLETTRALAGAGATVIVPARTPEKARASLKGIPNVEEDMLDLMNPASIDDFAGRFLASGRPLHILINNAGIMATPLRRDSRGYESQFSTNHLGHYQLTARLWPALKQAAGARVVSVSSRAHSLGGVDFSDPHFERREYDKWLAYAQSKTANVLFAVALDQFGKPYNIRAFSLHPGTIHETEIGRYLPESERGPKGNIQSAEDMKADLKTVEQGAATNVWCATSGQLDGIGGVYCEDADIAEAVSADDKRDVGVRPRAIDPELAELLWELSEKYTGVKFPV